MLKKIAFIIILIISIFVFYACEADKQVPLYQQMEESKVLPTLSIASISQDESSVQTAKQLTYEEISDGYFNEPVLDGEALGKKKGYTFVDENEKQRLTEYGHLFLRDLFNINYTVDNNENLEKAYDIMRVDLKDQIKSTKILQDRIQDFNKYHATTLIREANILNDNLICTFTSPDDKDIIRIRLFVILSLRADSEFYQHQWQFVPGDSTAEVWLYLQREDENKYSICGWEEYYINPERYFRFYPVAVQEVKLLTNEGKAGERDALGYSRVKSYTMTNEETEKVTNATNSFIDSFFYFNSDKPVKDSGVFSDELREKYENESFYTKINSAIQSEKCFSEIKHVTNFSADTGIVQIVEKDELNYYMVSCSFWCKLEPSEQKAIEITPLLGLRTSIRIYRLTVIFEKTATDGEFKIREWQIKETSEGVMSEKDFYGEAGNG